MTLCDLVPRQMKKARLRAGMSQPDIERATEELGYRVSASMVSKYERGLQDPTVRPLLAFCIVTRTNPTWILTNKGEPSWSPASGWEEEQELLAARLERIAEKLRVAVEEGVDLVGPIEVLSESEMEKVDLPGQGNKPGPREARHEEAS